SSAEPQSPRTGRPLPCLPERFVFQVVVLGPTCFRCRLRLAIARCLLLSKHGTARRYAYLRRNQDAKDRARQPSDGASDIFSHFSSIPFVRVVFLIPANNGPARQGCHNVLQSPPSLNPPQSPHRAGRG